MIYKSPQNGMDYNSFYNKSYKQDMDNFDCPYLNKDSFNNNCSTYDNCNYVNEQCQVVDVPHYVNYHTHNIMNICRKHVMVPTYSESSEVRIFDDYSNNIVSNPTYNNGFNNFFVPFF